MIDLERFLEIRKRFGDVASWAVWAEEDNKPKSNIGNLAVLDPIQNPALLKILHGESILLGLNISRRIERPLGNFHDPSPRATDFKIRSAFRGTRFWGSYMTDIVKDFEEKASGQMMKFLEANNDFELENIQRLREEIGVLGTVSPLLIALGRDAERIARRNLRDEFEIVRVPHYASRGSRQQYRLDVLCSLGPLIESEAKQFHPDANPVDVKDG